MEINLVPRETIFMAIIKSSYTVAEAAEHTDISTRMIDYLCRTGVVHPNASKHRGRGRGKRRLFTFADILLLQVIKKLLDQGISVARLKKSINKVRSHFANVQPEGRIIERYIFTDGKNAYFKSKEEIIDLLEHPDQHVFSFIVDVELTRKEILERAIDILEIKMASQPREGQ